MKNGWNLGHKPTNYARWVNANESYDVGIRTYNCCFFLLLVKYFINTYMTQCDKINDEHAKQQQAPLS